MHEDDAPPSQSETSRSSHRRPVWSIVVLGLCVLMTVFGIAFRKLDSLNQTWVQCQVTEAQPQRGDNYSTVPWYLKIQTSDCGVVAYETGIQQDNVEEISVSIEPGTYEFKFGFISQQAAQGRFFDNAAIVKTFRRVD